MRFSDHLRDRFECSIQSTGFTSETCVMDGGNETCNNVKWNLLTGTERENLFSLAGIDKQPRTGSGRSPTPALKLILSLLLVNELSCIFSVHLRKTLHKTIYLVIGQKRNISVTNLAKYTVADKISLLIIGSKFM